MMERRPSGTNRRPRTGERPGTRPYRKQEENTGDRSDTRPYRRREENTGEGADTRPYRRREENTGERSDARPYRRREERTDGRSDTRPNRRQEERTGGRSDTRPNRRQEERTGDRADTRPYKRREDRTDDRPGTRPFRRQEDRNGDRAATRPVRRQDERTDERSGSGPYRRREEKTGDRSDSRPYRRQEDRTGARPGRRHEEGTGERFRDKTGKRPGARTGARPAARPGAKPGLKTAAKSEGRSDGPIRLNRFIANSGICSRREADELISNGLISVNGKKVTDMGVKVSRDDKVDYNGKALSPEKKVYILLNKPKGYVTTTRDPHAEQTVLDLVSDATDERIYPVGRLDKATTGVLLLTNDGDLAGKLTHPKYGAKKVYHVFADREITRADMEQVVTGIDLEGETVSADAVSYPDPEDHTQVGLEIHSGQNRVVRRIFESLGYKVKKLDRVSFAGLTKKNLQRGMWRHLSMKEVNMLKRGIYK